MRKSFIILGVLLIFALVLSGCSPNPMTGKYGPSWDVTLRLPVASENNTIGDIVGASEFTGFGYDIVDGKLEGFHIVGTEDKPIVKEVETELPELEIELPDLINVSTDVPVIDGGSGSQSIDVVLADDVDEIVLGNGEAPANQVSISVENNGGNWIDNLRFELQDMDENVLDYIEFNNISPGETVNNYFNLNNETLTRELQLVVSYNQLSGSTNAHINMNLHKIQVVKVAGLSASLNQTIDFTTPFDIGDAISIDKGDGDHSSITVKLNPPESSNLNIEFHTVQLGTNTFIDNQDGSFTLTGDSIDLNGDLTVSGKITSGETITYDATDYLRVDTSLVGEVSFNIPDMEIIVEDNYLVYQTDPMKIEITDEDLDRMEEGIKEAYLNMTIDNTLPINIYADIYIGNDEARLYNDENKLSTRLLDITSGESTTNKFFFEQEFRDKLRQLPVYMGIEFKFGNPEDLSPTFTSDQTINTKAYVGVTVKVNQ